MKLIYIALAFGMCSCALMGSSSKLHQRPDEKIKTIAVFIAQEEVIESDNTGEYLVFTKTLAEELAYTKLFKFTIMQRVTTRETFDEPEQFLAGQNLSGKYDAFLIATPLRRGGDYKVELKLFETNPTRLLITAKHGTNLGNSYWMPPHAGAVLIDATRGAVEALERSWRKI